MSQEGTGQLSMEEILKQEIKITKLKISGLGRSKDDFIIKVTKPMFQAKTVEEFILKSNELQSRLAELQVTKAVQCDLVEGKTRKDSHVIIRMREKRLLAGGFSGSMQNELNEQGFGIGGAMKGMFVNLFGRAEKLSYIYSKTLSSNNNELVLEKPVGADLKSRVAAGIVFGSWTKFAQVGFQQMDKGVSLSAQTFSKFGSHKLSWSGVWRNMIPSEPNTHLELRQQAGHSLKSAVKHEFTADTRDNNILPRAGNLFKLTNEIAGLGGLGGDTHFLSNQIITQFVLPLPLRSCIITDISFGHINSLTNTTTKYIHPLTVMDKYYLGGPSNVNGFKFKGVAPNADKSGVLGADSFWRCGVSLRVPLPGEGSFLDKFKIQLFANSANLFDFKSDSSLKDNIEFQRNTARLSCGIGLVTSLFGVAKLEVNYCVPLVKQKHDQVQQGFQFGLTLPD